MNERYAYLNQSEGMAGGRASWGGGGMMRGRAGWGGGGMVGGAGLVGEEGA